MDLKQLKQINIIQKHLKKIEEKSFDEDDIKSFLIDIREMLPNSNLREISDSVAHPERDKGRAWMRINDYYWKLQYAPIAGTLKPPEQLNIYELSTLELDNFCNSISLLTPELERKLDIDKDEIKQKVKSAYKKENGNWILRRNKKNIRLVRQAAQDCICHIHSTSVMEDVDIIDEMKLAIRNISSKYPALQFDIELIDLNRVDIIFCVFGLLHNVRFQLYDGTEASFGIGTHNKDGTVSLDALIDSNRYSHGFMIPVISTSINESELNIVGQIDNRSAPFYVRRNSDRQLELAVIQEV